MNSLFSLFAFFWGNKIDFSTHFLDLVAAILLAERMVCLVASHFVVPHGVVAHQRGDVALVRVHAVAVAGPILHREDIDALTEMKEIKIHLFIDTLEPACKVSVLSKES